MTRRKKNPWKAPVEFIFRRPAFSARKNLSSLSEKEKTFAKECKDKGVWLELFCPDDACFVEEERIKLPVFCEHPEHDHSLWLDIFCPGGSCEVTDSTKLP